MASIPVVKLPLRVRLVVAPNAKPLVAPIVHCPIEGASVEASHCTTCPHLVMMTWDLERGGDLTCGAIPFLPAVVDRRDPIDFAEAAARRQLHEVVRPVTYCVAAGTSIGDARRLLGDRDVRVLPVVDSDLHVVGILSRSDMLIAPDDVRVSTVMTSPVHTLEEHAPIAHAIALMAAEEISEVPIVTEKGQLVGVWHALDAVRWTAERIGYVFPEAEDSATRLRANDSVAPTVGLLG